MQTTANIKIYIQALGGKFLGPNAFNTDQINLSVIFQGKVVTIPYHLTKSSNDGNISPGFNRTDTYNDRTSSFLPILSMPAGAGNPSVNYLTADNNTICGFVTLDFTKQVEESTINVNIPNPSGGYILLSQSLLLNYQQPEYKVIIIVPGLYLQKEKMPNNIAVYVKMMCGCPISTGIPKSFWPENDFLVTAEIFYNNGNTERKILSFTSNNTESLFFAPVNDYADIQYVNFTARQKSTGNIGYLSITYPL